MPNLLMVAFRFPPSPHIGARRSARFARYLPGLGWRVSVLTVKEEEHPPGMDLPPEGLQVHRAPVLRGLSRIIDLRNRLRGRLGLPARPPVEGDDGPRQERGAAAGPLAWWQGFKDLFSSLFTFPDQHVGWIPFALIAALGIIRREEVELIYTSGPPHSVHLLGLLLKLFTDLPWVADFRDPWARRPWDSDADRRTLRRSNIQRLESRVVRTADRVIMNTDWLHREFLSHYPTSARDPFVVIPNGFDPGEFPSPPGEYRGETFRITHAGTLYGKRDPRGILEAAARLVRSGEIPAHRLEILFIGKNDLAGFSLEDEARRLGLESVVRHIPYLPHPECLARMADSAVLLALQQGARLQVPAKVYEYIYLRRPVLLITGEGASADLVRRYELGRVADPDHPQEIEEALRVLYAGFVSGKASRPDPQALERFDIRNLARELSDVLSACLVEESAPAAPRPAGRGAR